MTSPNWLPAHWALGDSRSTQSSEARLAKNVLAGLKPMRFMQNIQAYCTDQIMLHLFILLKLGAKITEISDFFIT